MVKQFCACLVGSVLSTYAIAGGGYETNHPDVQWNTLETEHFAFHWPQSKRSEGDHHWFTTQDTVARLSEIAEAAYNPICEQLGYFPKEITHVVIYDQDVGWEGNGFAVAEMDWTGFAANWGPLFRQRGRLEFLSDVFVHEFAHIVSLKAYLPWSESATGFELGGLSEDEEWLKRWGIRSRQNANFDIGFSLMMSSHTPFWWAEGGAEYWSYSAGTNIWGTSRDAYLRTTFLEDRVLSPSEWTTRIDKGGFDGERGYNQGFAFGLYLRQRFGADVMSDMARISGKRWHWSWDRVVQKATGVEMDVLYADWLQYAQARFDEQVQAVKARGQVEGLELSLTKPPWELSADQVPKDWKKRSKRKRDESMDGETAYQELPRYSPDGTTLAWFENGLNLMKIKPEAWGAIGGKYLTDENKKEHQRLHRMHVVQPETRSHPVRWSPDSRKIVTVGPEDWSHPVLMDQGLTFNADGYNWNQLIVGTLRTDGDKLRVKWKPVPNTLRATEAAYHPNGNLLAFSRYSDGSHNLWTIQESGETPIQLTSFRDGTQIQGLQWNNEGTHLIMALFKNFKQDIWSYEVKTREWTRITNNGVEELDPFVDREGHIWFSSDLGGIYNVYSLDPDTGSVWKHTDVLGSTYAPDVTPQGHLLYTDFTGHGYRIKAMHKDKLKRELVAYPGICSNEAVDCSAPSTAFKEKLPNVQASSTPYKPFRAGFPLSFWPILRTTDRNVEGGAAFYLGDAAEKHALEANITFGKDNYLAVNYFNSQFWPTLGLAYSRYAYKGTYGYGEDQDGDPATNDLRVVDVKFAQLAEDAWATASYVPNYATWITVYGEWSRYSFRDTGDGNQWQPYMVNTAIGANIEWSPRGGAYAADDWINPRGGRRLYLDYSHRWSRLLDPEIAGSVYDDGQSMDSYQYNRLQVSWTEFIPVPATKHHTLQLDFDIGWIDRNVMGWDEFMAGGRHPYNWGNGTIGNNIQFSGFEGYSLSGETMLIANAAYRFPLLRDLNFKLGPVYTESVYLQVFGSVGNLWSYRIEGPSHVEGYSVVPDKDGYVRRELPFQDYAHKNSPTGSQHYALGDVGVELRVRAFIWNDWDWDGFLRFAYGLQPTAGYGDVNADLIQSSAARDAGSELSSEVEPPTLRVYAGIGTGW